MTSTEDDELWNVYAQKIKRIRRKLSPKPPKKASDKAAARIVAGERSIEPPKTNRFGLLSKNLDNPLEARREKALRQGDIGIEAKLDLHGMTQVEAYAALAKFMRRSVSLGKRCVLIVTGKGPGGRGVLRSNLRDWLSQLPEASQILALRQASVRHGGEGAFYVLLRKPRVAR